MMRFLTTGFMGLLGLLLTPSTDQAGQVSGTYESAAIHFVSLNVEWRF